MNRFLPLSLVVHQMHGSRLQSVLLVQWLRYEDVRVLSRIRLALILLCNRFKVYFNLTILKINDWKGRSGHSNQSYDTFGHQHNHNDEHDHHHHHHHQEQSTHCHHCNGSGLQGSVLIISNCLLNWNLFYLCRYDVFKMNIDATLATGRVEFSVTFVKAQVDSNGFCSWRWNFRTIKTTTWRRRKRFRMIWFALVKPRASSPSNNWE